MSDFSQIRYRNEADEIQNSEMNWIDIKNVVTKKKKFILVTICVSTLCVALLSFFVSPTYQASSRLIVDPNNYSFIKKELQIYSDPSYFSNLFQTKFHLLQSPVIIKKLIKNKDIINDNRFINFRNKIIRRNERFYHLLQNKINKEKFAEDVVISELSKVIKILPLPNSQIFTITAEGDDPLLVQKIVNIFAIESCNFDRQMNNNKYYDIMKRINTKIAVLEKEIQDINKYKERSFKNKKFIFDEKIYHRLFSNMYDDFEKFHLDDIKDKSNFSYNISDKSSKISMNDDYINNLNKQLAFYQTEIVKKENVYGKNHPEIETMRTIINHLKINLKNYHDNQKNNYLRSEEKIEESLDHNIDWLVNKYYEEIKMRSFYKMIENQLEAKYDAYHLLVEQYEKLRIDQQTNLDMMRLLDRATIPSVPIRPEIFKNIVLASLLSSFCSIAVVLIQYINRTSLKSTHLVFQQSMFFLL